MFHGQAHGFYSNTKANSSDSFELGMTCSYVNVFLFLLIFYWNIVNLQCCVSFRRTAK